MRKEARLGPLRVHYAPTGDRTRDLPVDQSDAVPVVPPHHGLCGIYGFLNAHPTTSQQKENNDFYFYFKG